MSVTNGRCIDPRRHWCVSCWDVCPGHDADGFCRRVNRAEIAARLTRKAAPPAVTSLHWHGGMLGQYLVLLDGEEIPTGEIWFASTGWLAGQPGFVQFGRLDSPKTYTRRGVVEIRPRSVGTESESVSITVDPPAGKIAEVNDWITCKGPGSIPLVGQIRSTDELGGTAQWTEGPEDLIGKQSRFSWRDPGLRKIGSPATLPGEYSARNTPALEVLTLDPNDIAPFGLQPRSTFSQEALEELSIDIQRRGQDNPILVRPAHPELGKRWELIAGERRVRACQLAGVRVLAINRGPIDDDTALDIATAENAHRVDLDPLDTARNIDFLLARGRTQERIGQLMGGKRQAWISKTHGLLRLPTEIQAHLKAGRLTWSHATALLGIREPNEAIRLARMAIEQEWSSRALDREAAAVRERLERKQQPTLLEDVLEVPAPTVSLCGRCGCSTTEPIRPPLNTVLCAGCYGKWAAENLEPGDETVDKPPASSQSAAPATLPRCAHCGGAFNGGTTTEHAGQRYCHRPPCVAYVESITQPADAGVVPLAPANAGTVQQTPPTVQPVVHPGPEEPANVPPVPLAPQKPGFLKSAAEKAAERQKTTAPAAPTKPSAWEGKTTLIIRNDLLPRMAQAGHDPETLLAAGCDLASVVGEYELPLAMGIELLKEFLGVCCDRDLDPAIALASVALCAGGEGTSDAA